MMIDAKEKTALNSSVGAEEGQFIHNLSEDSITISEPEINDQIENSGESFEEICRRLQRLSDPHYLHTVSMTELYQTTFDSRPSIIDGLLDAGAYLLVGSPKIGKSFLVAQIAYHVSYGTKALGF